MWHLMFGILALTADQGLFFQSIDSLMQIIAYYGR